MKRLFIMLLIACSAIITVSAQQRRTKNQSQATPIHVQTLFDNIIKYWGNPSDEVFSINKNPNTNLIESSVRITYFVAENSGYSSANVTLNLNSISEAFKKDEPTSYQLLHLSPGNNESFSLRAVDGNGRDKSYLVRASNKEEMWLLCTKNPENPQLRDAYAIKWTLTNDKSKVLGSIYQITSLRPDLYTKNMETLKKTFKIVGRVDENIKDSLYNIYIAESAEELANIGDDDYVACVPVINKRFEWQTELDKPMVGRLRCIFPDGELCSAWINLDFVPGETYNITVHNGYFDDDRDYENRVGRYSGKSLLNEKQIRGIDDVIDLPLEEDTVFVDTIPDYVPEAQRSISQSTPQWQELLKIQLESKMMNIKTGMETIKASYQLLGSAYQAKDFSRVNKTLTQIAKQNEAFDANFQDLIKTLKKSPDIPQKEKIEVISEGYKEILKFYTEQNQAFVEMTKELGSLPKEFQKMPKELQKTQKVISKLIEKNMNEMSKMISEIR